MEETVKNVNEVMENDQLYFKEEIHIDKVFRENGEVYIRGINKEGFVYYAKLLDVDGEQQFILLDIRKEEA